MAKKIVGWVLVAVGVLAIVAGTWQSYRIFSNKAAVPDVFKIEKSQETFLPKTAAKNQQELATQQLGQALQEQLGKMIPTDVITKTLNLTVWSIFMGILILAAGKIAGLGVNLLKA